ncbi:hypothetical protein CLOP_g4369 [Closterium sp. NIES-67]|nr:hypothetical protein CLOP_g4369 [Closterium sp. NIES-67]
MCFVGKYPHAACVLSELLCGMVCRVQMRDAVRGTGQEARLTHIVPLTLTPTLSPSLTPHSPSPLPMHTHLHTPPHLRCRMRPQCFLLLLSCICCLGRWGTVQRGRWMGQGGGGTGEGTGGGGHAHEVGDVRVMRHAIL